MVANQRNILVTGATGQQGGSLARLLLQKNIKYMPLLEILNHLQLKTSNRGAKILKGDLDDSDSLKRAVKDVQSIFLMGTPFEDGTEGEIRRGKLMADITKENNIEHLVYSSVANADKNTGIPHFESKYKVEQHIKPWNSLYYYWSHIFYGKLAWSRIRAGSTCFTFISIYHFTTKCS